MAAAVVLLSAPSTARSQALRVFGERQAAIDVSTHPVQLSAVRSGWTRRPALPEYVSPGGVVALSLVLLALAVAIIPRAFPGVRRSRPAVRGPPARSA